MNQENVALNERKIKPPLPGRLLRYGLASLFTGISLVAGYKTIVAVAREDTFEEVSHDRSLSDDERADYQTLAFNANMESLDPFGVAVFSGMVAMGVMASCVMVSDYHNEKHRALGAGMSPEDEPNQQISLPLDQNL